MRRRGCVDLMAIKLNTGSNQYRGENKNLFEINVVIEWAKPVYSVVAFLSIFEDFVRSEESKKITIMMDAFRLWQLIEGLGLLLEGGEEFTLQSGSNKKINMALLKKEDAQTFFLNFSQESKKISVPYNKVQAIALRSSLIQMLRDAETQTRQMQIEYSKKLIKGG